MVPAGLTIHGDGLAASGSAGPEGAQRIIHLGRQLWRRGLSHDSPCRWLGVPDVWVHDPPGNDSGTGPGSTCNAPACSAATVGARFACAEFENRGSSRMKHQRHRPHGSPPCEVTSRPPTIQLPPRRNGVVGQRPARRVFPIDRAGPFEFRGDLDPGRLSRAARRSWPASEPAAGLRVRGRPADRV